MQDRPAAEDVAGEVFLAAVAGIDRFDPTAGSLTPWLFAIARRRIADRLRLLYRQRRRGTMEPLRDELAERPPADFGLARRVQIALATLPAVQRDVLLWMHQEGLNVRQIADRLGRTQKAAENLLYRARLRFREAYQLSPELESWEPAPPALPFPPPASSRRSP